MIRPTSSALWVLAGITLLLIPLSLLGWGMMGLSVLLSLFGLACLWDLWALIKRPAPHWELDLAPVGGVGTEQEVLLTWDGIEPTSLSRQPLWVRVLADRQLEIDPPEVGKGMAGSTRMCFAVRHGQRGHHRVHAVLTEVAGPVGFLGRQWKQELNKDVVVTPDYERVRQEIRSNPEWGPGTSTLERYQGQGSEFDQLTEFRRGMESRHIDWKASARHQTMLARQFRLERDHRMVVAFDCGLAMRAPYDGVPRLDHALRAGMGLAYGALRAGDSVGAYAFDTDARLWVPPMRGAAVARSLEAALGGLEYSTEASNHVLGLTRLAERVKRRSLIVVFTEFQDHISAQLMVRALAKLAVRHKVIFVCLEDRDLLAARHERPTSWALVRRANLASDLLRRREVVLEDLRRGGVRVVSATSVRMVPELIKIYLDLKQREALA